MAIHIVVAKSTIELTDCFPVVKELRPHLALEDFLSIYKQANQADGYTVVLVKENSRIVAMMGYRILFDLVRGKHVYIDDLVSTESMRSKGIGAELLQYAEQIAKQEGCETLRLCTGIENESGVRFYEKNGWKQRAFAYTKKITT